ncbi:MAG: NAD(P)-dependent oxidoreductase, partial [Chloroflexota bacterium]
MSDKPRLAFVGLGVMGAPMAASLLRAGFPLTVHNRTRSREAPLVALGARSATLPAAVAGADIVLTCLKNPDAVEEIYFGTPTESPADGMLAAMRPGQILIGHETASVAFARRVALACRARGVDFLDAPVSGGVEGATAASLSIMAGGNPAIFERVEPVLAAMGRTVRHVGPTGSGQALKLANQLLVIVQQFAAAEAFAFAAKAGVDGEVFGDVILKSWGRSFMLERSMPGFLAGDFSGGRASVAGLLKDGCLV